ncbi:putative toxin-antitoxin system toxin component, PIN family [Candidatus Roizmanbacteria bacterium]|nr:putative toxin-antitoxin system toxin component, PIN family [Candidatus Roizmanbacteria bacterium]
MNTLLKVILDTNVFISALITKGNCRKILEEWNKERLDLYVTEEILEEIKKVGERQVFRTYFPLDQLHTFMRLLKERALVIKPKKIIPNKFLPTDLNDQIFVVGILASNIDYFVTGNPKHFPKKIGKTKIISPRELLTLI